MSILRLIHAPSLVWVILRQHRHLAQQEATAVAMSIFSGIFNLGIGCGTLLGGAVCTYSSISRIGFAGGLVAVGAFFYCTRRLLKRLNP